MAVQGFFFSSRRRHTRSLCDWSSDVCSSDLEWDFDEQTGVVAADSIGGNDGALTSSSAWSSLRATSTLAFYANGGVVAGVGPYDGTLAPATSSQFNLGAPAETGVTGFHGKIAQVSLWSAARTLET